MEETVTALQERTQEERAVSEAETVEAKELCIHVPPPTRRTSGFRYTRNVLTIPSRVLHFTASAPVVERFPAIHADTAGQCDWDILYTPIENCSLTCTGSVRPMAPLKSTEVFAAHRLARLYLSQRLGVRSEGVSRVERRSRTHVLLQKNPEEIYGWDVFTITSHETHFATHTNRNYVIQGARSVCLLPPEVKLFRGSA